MASSLGFAGFSKKHNQDDTCDDDDIAKKVIPTERGKETGFKTCFQMGGWVTVCPN